MNYSLLIDEANDENDQWSGGVVHYNVKIWV